MPATAKDRALRLLGVRSRSREEVRRRLTRAGFPEDEIGAALGDLEAVGLVDDERFARELAEHVLARRGYGRRAAMSALRRAGIRAEEAERAVEDVDPRDEEARAEELAAARLARLRGLPPAVAARRLVAYLQRRGFEPETARAACRRAMGAAEV